MLWPIGTLEISITNDILPWQSSAQLMCKHVLSFKKLRKKILSIPIAMCNGKYIYNTTWSHYLATNTTIQTISKKNINPHLQTLAMLLLWPDLMKAFVKGTGNTMALLSRPLCALLKRNFVNLLYQWHLVLTVKGSAYVHTWSTSKLCASFVVRPKLLLLSTMVMLIYQNNTTAIVDLMAACSLLRTISV